MHFVLTLQPYGNTISSKAEKSSEQKKAKGSNFMKFRKTLALVLAVVLAFAMFIPAFAGEVEQEDNSFTVLELPVDGSPFGKGNIRTRMKNIGKFVKENEIDIFAAQQDYSHKRLAAALEEYNSTENPGNQFNGNGTATFTTKTMYNETHMNWNDLSGFIDIKKKNPDGSVLYNGSDKLEKKGMTYTCIKIDHGVYIDFYNVVFDAGTDAKSEEARRGNYQELADIINNREEKRPLVIAAYAYCGSTAEGTDIYENLIEPAGLSQSIPGFTSYQQMFFKDGEGDFSINLNCTAEDFSADKDEKNISTHYWLMSKFTYERPEKAMEKPAAPEQSVIEGMFASIREFFDVIIDTYFNQTILRLFGIK